MMGSADNPLMMGSADNPLMTGSADNPFNDGIGYVKKAWWHRASLTPDLPHPSNTSG